MAKTLTKAEVSILERAEEIMRAKKLESKQPRFDPKAKSTTQFFYEIYNWISDIIYTEPKYMLDSRKRDEWLKTVVRKEAYLTGIVQSVVSVDKNRGWTISGGKTQVKKYTEILHNMQASADLYGWRNGISMMSENYYASDLGCVVEVGRTEKAGPLAGLYTVDSTKCRLTGEIDNPLQYYSAGKGSQKWEPQDYFRVVSMPSPMESLHGLGYCAVSRCIELAKLMVGIYQHNREKLGTRASKGLLLLNGITQDQWLASLEENAQSIESLEKEYYTGVQILAGDGLTTLSAELVPLSNLPDNFDHKEFTNMLIYGYALAFGYDPREFWPVSGGALGTSMETEQQHKKATGKGGLDFILGLQEKIQEELPQTIDFEFEQRDVDGEISESSSASAKLAVITAMYGAVGAEGEALITRSEARQLMAEQGLIPNEWTIQQEEVEVSDTDDIGEAKETERVRKAINRFGEYEDIVRYSSSTRSTTVIRRAGRVPMSIVVNRTLSRQHRKREKLFESDNLVITDEDLEDALKEGKKRLEEAGVDGSNTQENK